MAGQRIGFRARRAALLLASAVSVVVAAPAAAEVHFRLDHTPYVLGPGGSLVYQLQVFGDEVPHELTIDADGESAGAGPFAELVGSARSESLVGCASRLGRPHVTRVVSSTFHVSLPVGGETWVRLARGFLSPPWPGESLRERYTVTLDGGPPLRLFDRGPRVAVPRGVRFEWNPAQAARAGRTIRISGRAAPLPRGARVRVDWLTPGAAHPRELAVVRVRRHHRFHYRVRLRRPGRYDFTASHRSTRRFAADAGECGLVVEAR